jgi:hypothetical protein
VHLSGSYSFAETRHDSPRGPEARATNESTPNQSGTDRFSSIDPLLRVRRTLLLLAAVAGVAAAIAPARRASKTNIIEALLYE